MSIENNKYMFLACTGLIASGSDGYDHTDTDVVGLVGMIHAARFPDEIKEWFACARTGQVTVNPYWPRGSCLTAACFFVDRDFRLNIEDYLAFLDSTGGFNDPIGYSDFVSWISGISAHLPLINDHPATPALWCEYCRIVDQRSPQWNVMLEKTISTALNFFGEETPKLVFSPNLFTPHSADFVRTGNCIVTISSVPDVETMLHETLHTAIARYRTKIHKFAEKYGLTSFAQKDRMMELGYMQDESAASIAHVIEECFVRGLSAAFAGGSEERLQFHARSGFISVPQIAIFATRTCPSYRTLGLFVEHVLLEMEEQAKKRDESAQTSVYQTT